MYKMLNAYKTKSNKIKCILTLAHKSLLSLENRIMRFLFYQHSSPSNTYAHTYKHTNSHPKTSCSHTLMFVCISGLIWSFSSSVIIMKTDRCTQTGRRLCRSASTPHRSPSNGATPRLPTNPCTWSTCVSRGETPSRSQWRPAAV